ncbi:MAG: hypothetical protein KIH69_012920, partial [Anaerolineae bacterium]|nr:hypothetical protein [Anaerolineae bacterium]
TQASHWLGKTLADLTTYLLDLIFGDPSLRVGMTTSIFSVITRRCKRELARLNISGDEPKLS